MIEINRGVFEELVEYVRNSSMRGSDVMKLEREGDQLHYELTTPDGFQVDEAYFDIEGGG